MPPKVQPRRQPPRGSARRKAAEDVPKQDVPQPVSTKENLEVDNNTQGVSADLDPSGPSENPIALNDATLPSPNVPSTSSPPRQPAQRLASLHSRRTITPTSIPTTQETLRNRLKFQPKSAVRRSKESREAFEKAQFERRQSRIATENNSSSSFSGRGVLPGRGRGRGGRALFSGNRFGVDRFASSQATGHLGGSTVGEEGSRKKKNARGALLSGMARTSTQVNSTSTKAISDRSLKEIAVKSEKDRDGDIVMRSSSTKKLPAIKHEDHNIAYVSSDDEPDMVEGPRINIEHINLISDEDTEDERPDPSTIVDGNGLNKEPKIPNWSLKPIRIDRHEHIDRAIGVNTDASSLTSAELRRKAKERAEAEGSLFLDGEEDPKVIKSEKTSGRRKPKDVEFLRDERRWKGVYQDEEDTVDEPKIKDESKDYEEPMVIDSIDQPPTSSHSQNLNINAPIPETAGEKAPEDFTIHPKKNKQGQATWPRLRKPVLQTEEDHQEWARYERDLQLLGAELSSVAVDPVRPPTTSVADEDGDVRLDNDIEATKDRKEDLVYLFQLPPIVPALLTAAEKDTLTKTKEDKEVQENASENAQNSKSAANNKAKTISDNRPENALTNAFTALNLACPVGKVGTLRLHETGRVMATWGGASMELGRGGEGGLLQEVVMTDFDRTMVKVEDDGNTYKTGNRSVGTKDGGKEKEKCDEKIDLGSKGWAIGGLAGGFIMTPDWGRMFGG